MSADGTWKTTIKSPMGDQQGTLTVKTDGASFTGSMGSAQGSQEVSGKVDGNTLTWAAKLTQPMPMDLDFTVTVDGDAMTGTVKTSFGNFPLQGARA